MLKPIPYATSSAITLTSLTKKQNISSSNGGLSNTKILNPSSSTPHTHTNPSPPINTFSFSLISSLTTNPSINGSLTSPTQTSHFNTSMLSYSASYGINTSNSTSNTPSHNYPPSSQKKHAKNNLPSTSSSTSSLSPTVLPTSSTISSPTCNPISNSTYNNSQTTPTVYPSLPTSHKASKKLSAHFTSGIYSSKILHSNHSWTAHHTKTGISSSPPSPIFISNHTISLNSSEAIHYLMTSISISITPYDTSPTSTNTPLNSPFSKSFL